MDFKTMCAGQLFLVLGNGKGYCPVASGGDFRLLLHLSNSSTVLESLSWTIHLSSSLRISQNQTNQTLRNLFLGGKKKIKSISQNAVAVSEDYLGTDHWDDCLLGHMKSSRAYSWKSGDTSLTIVFSLWEFTCCPSCWSLTSMGLVCYCIYGFLVMLTPSLTTYEALSYHSGSKTWLQNRRKTVSPSQARTNTISLTEWHSLE